MSNSFNLKIETINEVWDDDTCDGCGHKYEKGEKRITGIESCCGGGCVRNLCNNCINKTYEMLSE